MIAARISNNRNDDSGPFFLIRVMVRVERVLIDRPNYFTPQQQQNLHLTTQILNVHSTDFFLPTIQEQPLSFFLSLFKIPFLLELSATNIQMHLIRRQ